MSPSQLIIKALHGFILKLRLSFKKQIKVIKIFAIRTKNHTYIKRISISAKSAASVKLLETQMLSPNGCKIKQYSKQLERILFFFEKNFRFIKNPTNPTCSMQQRVCNRQEEFFNTLFSSCTNAFSNTRHIL